MTEALNIRPQTNDLAISVDEVKQLWLFGLDFRNDNGEVPPDKFYENYIRSAMEWVQNELDIILLPTIIENEAHDYYLHDLLAFGYMQLFRRPLRKLTRYAIQMPVSNEAIEIDPTWFRPESFSGKISLVPGARTIDRFLAAAGYGAFSTFYGGDDHIPLSIYCDYECGFKDVASIPADLKEILGLRASLGPLNVFGDLIAGAGIASKAVSLDGLSVSVGTTSSATNSGYGARIIQYNKQIEDSMKTLRNKYRGIQMVVA